MSRRTDGFSLVGLFAIACAPSEDLTDLVDDWRDEVIYSIVTDRFDDGDASNNSVDGIDTLPGDLARWQGGDFAGIARRLDYLERLGVTTLWISPIVENVARTDERDGYHGYWASDFVRVNARFGSLDDLRALVRLAHARDMKVLLDVVTNHAGPVFFYDLDRDGDLDPGEMAPAFRKDGPYDAPIVWIDDAPMMFRGRGPAPETFPLRAEHFHRRGEFASYDADEREQGDFPGGLRDFFDEDDEVFEALLDTYAHWVRATDVDGFRIDAVPHMSHAFWRRFCPALRERIRELGKTQFLLLGEVFDSDPDILASYTSDGQLDATFDFPTKFSLIDGVVLEGKPPSTARGVITGGDVREHSRGHTHGVGLAPWNARVLLADNHDTVRIAAEIDDPRIPPLAIALVFTVGGIPSVYYGTEQDFRGHGGDRSRERLWLSGFREDGLMFRVIARLASLRRAHVALRRGATVVRWASDANARDSMASDAGLFVFERALDDDTVLIAANANAERAADARVMTGFSPGTRLRELLWDAAGVSVEGDGSLELSVPPRTAWIFAASD